MRPTEQRQRGSPVAVTQAAAKRHAASVWAVGAGWIVDVGACGWCSCVVGDTAALAGRVGELQAVSELLSGESARAAMLVMGEAGVGKSRLVASAADAISGADVVVLTGWCLPLSEGLPFLPVIDVLRGPRRAQTVLIEVRADPPLPRRQVPEAM